MFKFLEKHKYKFINSLIFKITWKDSDYVEYITYELYETEVGTRKVEIKTTPELMRQAETCSMYHRAVLLWLRGEELHESWFDINKGYNEDKEKNEAEIVNHPILELIDGGKGKKGDDDPNE